MPYKDPEKRKEYNREWQKNYRKTDKYKEYLQSEDYKEQGKRYEHSEKGKATRRNYNQSDAGRESQRQYRQTEKAKIRTCNFLATEKGKKYNREKSARYRINNPDKVIAVRIANKYLGDKPCSITDCDSIGEKHHEDYSNPLQVDYLCKEHHMDLHYENKRKDKTTKSCNIKNTY